MSTEGETPLDRLPPLARPMALALARDRSRERASRDRRCNVFQSERAILEDEVIPELAEKRPEALEAELAVWWKKQKAEQVKHAAQGRRAPCAALVPPDAPNTSKPSSLAEALGRAPTKPVRERHEPRRDEDAEERVAIREEARR